MGYPMDYQRVVNRNDLAGDYDTSDDLRLRSMIRGDLRRLEIDQRDPHHLACYAEACGVTVAQAKAVLDAFFAGNVREHAPKALDAQYPNKAWSKAPQRCPDCNGTGDNRGIPHPDNVAWNMTDCGCKTCGATGYV